MKTKSKISGYIIRSGAWAVFLSVAFIALSSASNSPNTWHKSAGTLASMTQRLRLRVNPGRSASQSAWRISEQLKTFTGVTGFDQRRILILSTSLDAVMSQAQLENKVTGYLRDSLVLEDWWQRPITAEQLQAEVDRVARDRKPCLLCRTENQPSFFPNRRQTYKKDWQTCKS